jgi:serine/threonine-protein kinase HipA
VDLERFFKVVVFHYLFHNGDAHLKNFSLIRNEQTGEYNLSPAYDLLNTRLHLPHESPMALELFKDGFATESYRIKSFYAYDDFIAFARKLGLVEARAQRFLKSIASKRDDAFSLIDRALLPDDCKQLYRAHLEDRIRACSDS